MKETSTKYKIVRDELTRAIKAGEFKDNQRLPAERELAERFGISRMTARRAIEDLEEADLVVRRGGSGSYIRSAAHERLANLTVHLICMAYESPLVQEFLRLGTQKIEQQGWHPHIVRVQTGYERAALQALSSGDPSMVFPNYSDLQGPLRAAMEQANGRTVLVGNYLEDSQIPCVHANDTLGMQLALKHLRSKGHQSIALICSHAMDQNESIQVAAWRAGIQNDTDQAEVERRFIGVDPPRMTDATEASYCAVHRYLTKERESEKPITTAFICTVDELAIGALAACRSAGRSVPNEISLVNLLDSPTMKFSYPPVTSIDVDFKRQIDIAFEMIETTIGATSNSLKERIVRVEPQLIERSSVAISSTLQTV